MLWDRDVGRLILITFALFATLFFVIRPQYDVYAHCWSIFGALPRPLPPNLPTFEPRNLTRHIVTGGLSQDPPPWLLRMPENIDYTYYPVLNNSTGYVNKGHEAMFYLQYIIDHYARLPDLMVFVHDHRRAWHNSDVADRSILHLLRDLQWEYASQEGFANLRCQQKPNCPVILPLHGLITSGKMENIFHEAWKNLFEAESGHLQPEIAATCCAQFVVSKSAVHGRSLQFYEAAKEWIMQSSSTDWAIGRVFEYSWHMIFGKPAIHCPDQLTCRKNLYGYDLEEF